MYVYIYIYVCIYIFTHIYIYIYICIYIYISTCIYVYIHVCVYTYIYIYIYICLHQCIYTYVHVLSYRHLSGRIHIYIYSYLYSHLGVCVGEGVPVWERQWAHAHAGERETARERKRNVVHFITSWSPFEHTSELGNSNESRHIYTCVPHMYVHACHCWRIPTCRVVLCIRTCDLRAHAAVHAHNSTGVCARIVLQCGIFLRVLHLLHRPVTWCAHVAV